MSANGAGGAPGDLQFDKVDLATPAAARGCQSCKRPIAGEYFQVGQAIICGPCAATLSGGAGRGVFLDAAFWGLAAAIVGAIAWYAVIKLTGYELGLLAIGVGFLVGRAVRKGGRGLGGWRYQALAMALTYLAIASAYAQLVPKAIGDFADGSQLMLVPAFLAAPFMAGAGNVMGMLIIGFGLYEAWKTNRRIPLSGPFRIGPAPAPIVAAPSGASPAARQS
jgi:hypothetical protein